MYEFDIKTPTSTAAATDAFADSGDGQFLAGGQTLIPVLKQRLAMPEDLIALDNVSELSGITVADGLVSIKAMTCHAAVAASADVQKAIPALAKLAGGIGDPHVRNRGTIGGSIANNDPAADYPAAVLGLGATIVTNTREIAADDFFTGMFDTALDEGELITEIKFPIPDAAGYLKFPNPATRYALVGVMVSRSASGVRVAVTGATDFAHRGPKLEAALNADFSASAVDSVELPVDQLNVDIHCSAEYRANLVKVMTKRAIEACS